MRHTYQNMWYAYVPTVFTGSTRSVIGSNPLRLSGAACSVMAETTSSIVCVKSKIVHVLYNYNVSYTFHKNQSTALYPGV